MSTCIIYIYQNTDRACQKKIYLSSYFAETFWPRWAKLTGCQVANNGPLTSANTHFTSQKGVKRPTIQEQTHKNIPKTEVKRPTHNTGALQQKQTNELQ